MKGTKNSNADAEDMNEDSTRIAARLEYWMP
jgi:hypothetical protein